MSCPYGDNCSHRYCGKVCLRKTKLDGLYSKAMIPDKYKTDIKLFLDGDNSDQAAFIRLKEIKNNIEKFVEEGQNLYIHSSICGNGKTSWAVKLIRSYLDKIWLKSSLTCKVLFVHVPTLFTAIKDNINSKNEYAQFIKANVMYADLVVFDDCGTKVGTEFELNTLLSMIDGRITLGKSCIYTSNLSSSDMTRFLGERLASRICNYSENIEFKGADKRNRRGEN